MMRLSSRYMCVSDLASFGIVGILVILFPLTYNCLRFSNDPGRLTEVNLFPTIYNNSRPELVDKSIEINSQLSITKVRNAGKFPVNDEICPATLLVFSVTMPLN